MVQARSLLQYIHDRIRPEALVRNREALLAKVMKGMCVCVCVFAGVCIWYVYGVCVCMYVVWFD